MDPASTPLVTTIKERCRLCYTCVRECPAKAIRIAAGQAEVLSARCIGCGNCIRVCSQEAKLLQSGIEETEALLAGKLPVAALVAPSFAAEYADVSHEHLVGMLRSLGFTFVHEVAFGADLVADAYRRLLADHPDRRFIATTCPAVVAFVERYHPELVGDLAPIVSPMIAAARVMRQLHGANLRVVFIGPCVAKKGEADSTGVHDEVDAVLTFGELHALLRTRAIKPESVVPSDFDGPHAGTGALFPLRGGMLQAAEIREDLLAGDVVCADGRQDFVEAVKEFEGGNLDCRLLEILCCNGCIMGAGMTTTAPVFKRRAQVSKWVQRRLAEGRREATSAEREALAGLDLSRGYTALDQRIAVPSDAEIAEIMHRLGKTQPQDELNCGACGYETCRDHAIAIYKGLAENEMCLPFTIEALKHTCQALEISHEQLASTQEALLQSEKLASMGQLAAGIAHEVNNPLGTVLMLSHMLLEELEPRSNLREDLSLMASEAERCRKIVAGLLQFARKNKVEVHRTDIAGLVERTLRKVRVPSGVEVQVEHADPALQADLDEDQIAQVLINLLNNAVDALPDGGRLTVRTAARNGNVLLQVCDTGTGIADGVRQKIFEPFFTTKPAGKGTGLGLSVTYGIIKMHHGDVRVESNADPAAGPTGTTFTVTLPRERVTRGASELGAGPDDASAGALPASGQESE